MINIVKKFNKKSLLYKIKNIIKIKANQMLIIINTINKSIK
jgi:hypothetical protein